MKLAMGIYDAPERQLQAPFELELLKNNVAVFGGPMTGKTTFIETLLVRLNRAPGLLPEENTYIIDFGGSIGRFGTLPSVCACFDSSNEENIKRIFKTLEARLVENARSLGSENYYTAAEKHPDRCPPHLTLIIENLNAFLSDERYSTYRDKLLTLCRDGLSKGLSVVITANDTAGTNRLMSCFGQKVAFEMPADSYFEIFNTKVTKPMKLPGRGLINLDSFVYEFQAFFPYAAQAQYDALWQLPKDGLHGRRLIAFPEVLTQENYAQYCSQPVTHPTDIHSTLIGLDYYEQKPIQIDLTENRSIAIYGKRQFGKTNLLWLLLRGAVSRNRPTRLVFLDDGRRQLRRFYETDWGEHVEMLYFTAPGKLREYLVENAYFIKPPSSVVRAPRPAEPEPPVERENPYTVFVLQNKSLFLSAENPDVSWLMKTALPDMIAAADSRDLVFIYPDAKKIAPIDARTVFNNSLSSAFLLDDIGDFIIEKGKDTIFGEMDAKELKAEYAKCSRGDGFYYNPDAEADELMKMKILKA